VKKIFFGVLAAEGEQLEGACGGGSGRLAVNLAPLERGDQGGHFDTKFVVAVAVLRELWWFEKRSENKVLGVLATGGAVGGCVGGVAVVVW
jgi:predicted ATPase with chaperone activity